MLAFACSGEPEVDGSERVGSLQEALTLAVPFRVPSLEFVDKNELSVEHYGNCGTGPVDAETTSDPNGGGCNVGWTQAGEWLDYSITTPTARSVNLVARVASAEANKTLRLLVDGQDVGGLLTVPSGGWQAFEDRAVKDVSLSAGTHTIRVQFETGMTNFNYLDVTPGTVTLPARIEAEDYQRAYDTTVSNNQGNACNRNDGVDKENTGDSAGGGCNIGWTTPGEWLEYDVIVPQAGTFDFTARFGSGLQNGTTVRVSVDGTDIGLVSVPNTGWAGFVDRTIDDVNLTAGPHTIRVLFPEGETNFNYLNITSDAPPPPDGSAGYSFGAAADYNIFVFGDMSSTPSVGGPVAAGRDIVAHGFGFNTTASGAIGALAGRNVTATNGSIYRDLVYGSNASLSGVGVLQGTTWQGTPVDFAAEKANLNALSRNLAELAVNGSTAVDAWGTVTFTGGDPVLNVFAADAAAIGSSDVLNFDAPASSTVVVNVSGSNVIFETTGMQLGSLAPGHVIWNFPSATTLQLNQMGFKGTLLGSNAAVTQNGVTFEGVLIAGSLAGSGNGTSWFTFDGPSPFGDCAYCSEHSQCQEGSAPNDFTCVCDPGHAGEFCDIVIGDGEPGDDCASNSDCGERMICGLGHGPRYGKLRGTNACIYVDCLPEPSILGCGWDTAPCGLNCENARPCEPDAPEACGSSEVCLDGKGHAMGWRADSVCGPAMCLTEVSPPHCGTTESTCGECACTPSCAGKQCGDNQDDGCGGYCLGMCDDGELCKNDLDCPMGSVCGRGIGSRFGLPQGTNACWPAKCANGVVAPECPGNEPEACTGDYCSACQAGEYAANGTCTLELPRLRRGGSNFPEPLTPMPTDPVGATPGFFGVSDRGTAEYSIPIEVPPGRLGMQPSLALSYSSSKANGSVGIGWNLTGLSSITRCRLILGRDGDTRPVRLDGKDRFCLDGQALVQVNGAAYGRHDAEYRTEIDSFTKIVSYGGSIAPDSYTGPSYFKAWTKDGRILTYGRTEDASVFVNGSIKRVWAVNRIEDRSGNFISIEYLPHATIGTSPAGDWYTREVVEDTGEILPHAIGYGGKLLGEFEPATPDKRHSRFVRFEYEDRSDPIHHYVGGVQGYSTHRLMRVDTFVQDELVRSYELDYVPTSAFDGASSQLEKVQECATDPVNDSKVCKVLASTTFRRNMNSPRATES